MDSLPTMRRPLDAIGECQLDIIPELTDAETERHTAKTSRSVLWPAVILLVVIAGGGGIFILFPTVWAQTRCLAGPHPNYVRGPTNSTNFTAESLSDVASILTRGADKGDFDHDGPPNNDDCIREVPRIIHFIWIGSTLPAKYAVTVAAAMEKNPNFAVMLWLEFPLKEAETEFLAGKAAGRPAGPVVAKLLDEEVFRAAAVLAEETNPGTKTDVYRLELLYKYGGIYMDTDMLVQHGYDAYGSFFRWPFVIYEPNVYMNISNDLFGVPAQAPFVDMALRRHMEVGPLNGNPRSTGILTGALLKWNSPYVSMINRRVLVAGSGFVKGWTDASWIGVTIPKETKTGRRHAPHNGIYVLYGALCFTLLGCIAFLYFRRDRREESRRMDK
eukprot:GEMP01063398.1.p1 GENE.GEMP01063398.1~~GEMP01063398.1.p1  ORF type:complete len:387 (+),score=74.37 GEMP01063398.1:111-1271(+)